MVVSRFFKGGLKEALEHAVKNTIQPTITGVLEIPEPLGIEDAEDEENLDSDENGLDLANDIMPDKADAENGKNPSN